MPTQSELTSLSPKEIREYGFARVRDAAFDAVNLLWARRQTEGMTQADLASKIDADAGWLSKNLRGPGNWTLRTFGAFVESLGGDVEITVRAAEDPLPSRMNSHAYVEYPETRGAPPIPAVSASGVQGKAKRSMRPVVTTLIP